MRSLSARSSNDICTKKGVPTWHPLLNKTRRLSTIRRQLIGFLSSYIARFHAVAGILCERIALSNN
jgi:hypothetical protein